MLLFKPYHIFPIVCGNVPILPWVGLSSWEKIQKTETRRAWERPRAKVGSEHQCKLNFYDPFFAKVRILDVYEQPFGEMTEEAAQREGGYSLAEYSRLWQIINKKALNPLEEVYVVEMECVEVDLDMAAVVKYGSMYREHMQALRSAA